MRIRARAAWLASASLIALIPATAAAAYPGPAPSHPAIDRSLSWKIVPSPNRGAGELYGVTCLSATSCTAVGSGNSKTLVESWNGTAWSLVPSPSRRGTDMLSGVSCLSASACTAVGWSAPPGSSRARTLVESWNGTAWSLVPSPNPHQSLGPDILTGVSCVTAAFCAAVGNYGQADSELPLTEIWNGSTWAAAPMKPNNLIDSSLQSVSCVSATACTAVGFEYQETVVESWNGRTWSLVPSPDRTSEPGFSGVSCTSARACAAVGSYVDDALPGAPDHTLIESNSGGAWSVVPSPNAGGGASDGLAGVACVSRRACIAVGSVGESPAVDGTLIESWNGTRWSVVPGLITSGGALLYGVSCPSATMCMATGVHAVTSSHDSGRTLTELGTSSR